MAEIAHTLDETAEPSLHDEDFFAWTQAQGALLRRLRLPGLDARNVAEEIEDLGKSQKQAIESNLNVILLHLLKWHFQPERWGRSWRNSIIEHRRRVWRAIEDSPSLRGHVEAELEAEHRIARLKAAEETQMPDDAFPTECPYTAEQALDDTFWPGPLNPGAPDDLPN